MQKLIAKLLVILIILQIISPINFIGQVFAASNIWDFNDSSNYTLSDSDVSHIKIENSKVRLPYHLEHLGAITDDNLDQARRVIVKGNYAFVSAYDADNIVSIDITDPTNPTISNIIGDGDDDGNGGTINLDGPRGLTSTGNYLYVSSYKSDNINIFNIEDPSNISFVREITEDDNDDLRLNGANDIKIYGDHLYVTAYRDDALNIFDISDLEQPEFKKEFDNSKLDGINRINVTEKYAYAVMDTNDSFAVIDLTNQDEEADYFDTKPLSIVGEVEDGDDGALLDGARGLTIVDGNIAYVSSNISDALEFIDISDPTNPVHTGSISNGGDIKLDANRQTIVYNDFAFSSARSSDAIEVVDIINPANPKHESYLERNSEILLNGANDIFNSGSIFYSVGNVDDSLEIMEAKYSNNSPYVVPVTPYNYTGAITSISDTLGSKNEGNISYQISKDSGDNWYYFDGEDWNITTEGVINSNSILDINNNLYTFNRINNSGTGSFLFKAFLTSNGNKKVELENFRITTVENPTEIGNPVFWFDGQDVDGDSGNEPNDGDEVSPLSDKFNGYDSYNDTSGEVPIYKVSSINDHPSLYFDGNNDNYTIDNQDLINTDSEYYEKSFSIVFKTGDDVSTFQNIYEQGGNARGYTIQIEDGNLYAGAFNNEEWEEGDQYKFVNLGKINENQNYYLTMIHEARNSQTLKVYLDSNLIGELPNVDYQRKHGGTIGVGSVAGNIIKASDNSSTEGPAYFKGNIGELISWNYALSTLELQGIDYYIKNKWDLDFKVYPIIIKSSILNNELFSTGSFDFYFNYKDGQGGTGIDDTSAEIELYKWNPDDSSWGDNIASSGIIEKSITTSTGSYSTDDLDVGEYKINFYISNNDGNKSMKEVSFEIDPIGIIGKVFHFDAQNIDGDGDSSNEPNNGDNISKWNDIKNGYNSTQTTEDDQAKYSINSINKYSSILFDGVSDFFNIGNEDDINTASNYDVKSFSMILKTGDDIDTFQDLYEQGGGTRGYSIQIGSGALYMGAWNNAEWDDDHEYKFVNLGEINRNEIYNILFIQDSRDGTDSGNIIKAYIDGQLAGILDHVDIQKAHSGDIVLGKNHDGRKYNESSPGDGHFLKGNIGEFISWNYSLEGDDIENLNEYLRKRWSLDKVAPIVSSINYESGSILPGGIHNVEFNYSDTSEYGTGAGINIDSGNIVLEKWDLENSVWSDISDEIGTGTLTQTGANYPTLNLDYGKYKINFNISDNNGNISNNFESIFYIDIPEFNVSTGNAYIGELNSDSNTFGDTITITVKTIGAPFEVKLKRNTNLTHSNNSDYISYYDGNVGIGYDKNDDGELYDFYNDIILNKDKDLNTDGELNIYTYELKIGAITEKLQASGDYEAKIDFEINIDY